jgi:flagellar protein FlaG
MTNEVNSFRSFIPHAASPAVSKPQGNKDDNSTQQAILQPVRQQNAASGPQTAAAAEPTASQPVPADELTQAVEVINQQVQNMQRSLEFSVEDDTGVTVVRVYDSETEELVRQIPAEEVVDLARKMHEYQTQTSGQHMEGMLVQEKT